MRKSAVYIFSIWTTLLLTSSSGYPQIVVPYSKPLPDMTYLEKPVPRILFLRSEYTKSGREINSIWIAERNGSDQRFVSYCSVGFALYPVAHPTLSPDKGKVVFPWLGNVPSEELPDSPEKGLWMFDLKTNAREWLYSEVPSRVIWSSDSRSLFFARGKNGLFRLDVSSKQVKKVLATRDMEHVVDVTGKTVTTGATVSLEDVREEQILFTRDCFDPLSEWSEKVPVGTVTQKKLIPRRHVWLFTLKEESVRLLSEGSEAMFIPDSRRVVFTKRADGDEGKGVKEVWLIDVDGTREIRLGRGNCVSVSPDGKWLAYVDRGNYVNPFGWFNLMVANIESGQVYQVQKVEEWKEIVSRDVPSFSRIFGRYGYFQGLPGILWYPSGEKFIHGIGYAYFFVADMQAKVSFPLFHWKVQVEPMLECIDGARQSILLTSPMIETPRRKKHPLRSSGWMNERDIWEVSLDGKTKGMLIENAFAPLLIEN